MDTAQPLDQCHHIAHTNCANCRWASVVQHPERKIGVALLYRGEQVHLMPHVVPLMQRCPRAPAAPWRAIGAMMPTCTSVLGLRERPLHQQHREADGSPLCAFVITQAAFGEFQQHPRPQGLGVS